MSPHCNRLLTFECEHLHVHYYFFSQTLTMAGNADSLGVIPLAVMVIFQIIAQTPHSEFTLRVGYIEIFMERPYDLLDATVKESRIRLVKPNGREFEVSFVSNGTRAVTRKAKKLPPLICLSSVSTTSRTFFSLMPNWCFL